MRHYRLTFELKLAGLDANSWPGARCSVSRGGLGGLALGGGRRGGVVDAADSLDVLGTMADGTTLELRDAMVHIIEEYARHSGHADLLRECIDGRTGQ